MEHTVSIFRAEDGRRMFLRNAGICRQSHAALQPRRPTSSESFPSYTPRMGIVDVRILTSALDAGVWSTLCFILSNRMGPRPVLDWFHWSRCSSQQYLRIQFIPQRKDCASPFTGYCYGVVSYKASYALRPFSDLLWDPNLSSNHS
jgi:hypothetical protein